MFLLLCSLSLSKLKRDPVARLASSFPHPTKGPKQLGLSGYPIPTVACEFVFSCFLGKCFKSPIVKLLTTLSSELPI